MKRRLFTLCAAVSLLLCVAVCVLWVRSYWVWNDVHAYGPAWYQRYYHLPKLGAMRSRSGGVCVWWSTADWLPADDEYRSGPGRPVGWRVERHPVSGGYPAVRGRGIVPTIDEPTWLWKTLGVDAGRYTNRTVRGHGYCRTIVFPYWMPALLLAAPPALAARAVWRQSGRVAAGLCPACGYDLRATPDRCPECGAAR